MQVAIAVFLVAISGTFAQDCSQHPRVHPHECCEIPKMVDESVMQQCKPEGGQGRRGPPSNCMMDCAFKAAGISQNGVINRDSLASAMTSKVSNNPELVTVITNAVNTCVTSSGAAASPPPNQGTSSDGCDRTPGVIFGCLFREMMLNCPASIAKNSDACDQFKLFIKNCPPPQMN